MDVRCERCKTEYEFDDDRIAEDGVTVKCTTCGNVFVVKKATVAGAAPVASEEDLAAAMQPGAVPAGAERPKEWKVRQANGNVFTFKELTTLQKWIVERKVKRDDEISLTGESWKRLGNIGELGAFFDVVDEAQRAARMTARSAGPPEPANHGMTPPTGMPPAGPSSGTSHESATAPGAPTYDFDSFSFRQSPPDSPRSAQFEVNQDLPPAQRTQEPAFAKNDPAQSFFEDDEALAAAAGFRKGPSRQLVLILGLVGVVVAGYLVYYFAVWRPAQNRGAASPAPSASEGPATPTARERAVADKTPVQKPAPGEPAPRGRPDARAPPSTGRAAPESASTAEPEPKSPATAATAEREPVIPEQLVPGRATTGTARSDSRALDESRAPSASAAAPDAGVSAPTIARAEPRTFDFYMGQGDKLREREQPKAALEAYRKAAELEPGRAEPIAGRALALLDLGQKLQAQVWFQQALKLNPTYGVALMGLAEAYRADGKTSDAIRYYEKYLEVLPDGPEASVARSAIKNLQEPSRD